MTSSRGERKPFYITQFTHKCALALALQAGHIAGAGLDVFEIEPLPEDHPLWDMEQVIITPHIAASSTHVAERHLATLLQNVANFANGQPLLNVVDKQIWC